MADFPLGGGGVGATGWLKVVDVTPQNEGDVVTDKVYQDTGNTILQSCTSSSLDVKVSVKSAFPFVTIEATEVELTESSDGGHYAGDVSVTLSASGTIPVISKTPDNGVGARDNVIITVVPPPTITAMSFTGGYPGAQTEVKAGDNFTVQGTTDKDIDAVEIMDLEAGTSEIIPVATGTSFSVAITVADRGTSPQALPAHVRARDAATGAYGPVRATDELGGTVDGVDLIWLNNLYPSVSIGTVTYPGAQEALKDVESATVVNVVTNYSSIVYNDPLGQLTITNLTTYENPKSVTRLSGDYNISTPNFRITATRAANGAVTIDSDVVQIAHTFPVITVSSASRLRSGGNNGTSAQDHTITLSSDQQLLSTPSLDADSGGSRGTFQGSWSGGPTSYTRALRIDETIPDEKGTFAWEGLVAEGLAGRIQNTVGVGPNYTLGGFVARNLTFAAFATQTQLDTEVVTFAKLTAGIFTATNQPALKQAIGTPPPVINGYTIDAVGINPTQVIWLDTDAAGSNSSGTAQITDVEETV